MKRTELGELSGPEFSGAQRKMFSSIFFICIFVYCTRQEGKEGADAD